MKKQQNVRNDWELSYQDVNWLHWKTRLLISKVSMLFNEVGLKESIGKRQFLDPALGQGSLEGPQVWVKSPVDHL